MIEDLIKAVEMRTGLKVLGEDISDTHFLEDIEQKVDGIISIETIKLEQAIDKAHKADGIAEAKFVIGMVKAFRHGNSPKYWKYKDGVEPWVFSIGGSI